MTANASDTQRVACYGDKIAVIEKGRIVKQIIIEERTFKEKIDEVIDKKEVALDPYHIFRKTVEDITGYKYFGFRNSPVIEGVQESIHDQKIYKKWRDYILANECIKKSQKSYLENLKAKKKVEAMDFLILGVNNSNFRLLKYNERR